MVDEDHNGTVDNDEYNNLIRNFDSAPIKGLQPMNQQTFINRLIETQDHVKVLSWWKSQSNFSHSLNTTVQMLLLVHTPVTRLVFQYFNCNLIHEKYFLKADYSIECWSATGVWNVFLLYVLVIGFLFTVGFPLGMALYIRHHRKELYTPKIQSRIGFLYSNFTKNAEFWEVHEIIRKTLLTGVIIYLQARPTMQASVAIMVCSLACCTLNYFEPHKNRVIFWLAQLSFIITNLKFLSAVILVVAKDSVERENIGTLLISLDILFFVGSVIGTIMAIYILWHKIKEINRETAGMRGPSKNVPIIPGNNEKVRKEDQSIGTLQELRKQYGASSEEYKAALSKIDMGSKK